MVSVSYAGKNTYSAGKTSEVLRGGASGANRGYVLAHYGGGRGVNMTMSTEILNSVRLFSVVCVIHPTLPHPSLPCPGQNKFPHFFGRE